MSLDQNSFIQGLRVAMLMGRKPRTPFLERQKIRNIGNVTAISVAARRINMVRKSDRIYIAYVQNGHGKLVYADYNLNIAGHAWIDTTFDVEADDIEIAFNGRCYSNGPEGKEFVTQPNPWIFWIKNGECRGKVIGSSGDDQFAAENCTKISAICDFSKDAYNEGYGFILFMIISGQIYYRQLLGNGWTDAELVNFGPPGVTWTDLHAFRTWDYRVGIQAITNTGEIYELFSQFEGIGRTSTEHINISAKANGRLIALQFYNGYETEHISVNAAFTSLYGGLYEINTPIILDIYNIENENHDWGKIVVFSFNRHLNPEMVAAQPSTFIFIDSRGIQYTPTYAHLDDTGKNVIAEFADFNSAYGVCIGSYIPGSVKTMAGYTLIEVSYTWTPQNLTPPAIPLPEVVYIENI